MSQKQCPYTVEWEQSGQPRAYADSIFSGVLTITGEIEADEESQARRYLAETQRYRARTVPRVSEPHEWWQGYLTSLEKISPGVWSFRLVEPYTD